MIQIHKIAHLFRQLTPLSGELHHVFTALMVIILCGYVFLGVVVIYIFLGDSQFFLHAKLNGKSMGIPPCLTGHLITPHGFISIKRVLNTARQHMVNTRMTICRWRAFEKYKLWTSFSCGNSLVEDIILLPFR